MVEHALGVGAIGRVAVSAHSFLDRSIDQIIFAVFVKHLIERSINRLSIDFLPHKLTRKPGSSDGPHT